jgi:hypothetical protein
MCSSLGVKCRRDNEIWFTFVFPCEDACTDTHAKIYPIFHWRCEGDLRVAMGCVQGGGAASRRSLAQEDGAKVSQLDARQLPTLLSVSSGPGSATSAAFANAARVEGLRSKSFKSIRSSNCDGFDSECNTSNAVATTAGSKLCPSFASKSWSSTLGSEKPIDMKLLETPAGGGFVAAFDRKPAKNFVFLVPGDEELFVGGGALNGAVGKLLQSEAGQPIAFTSQVDDDGKLLWVFDKTTCVYRRMHEKLFERSSSEIGELGELVVSTASERVDTPVSFCAARLCNQSPHPFGAAFLDIFKGDRRPYGCEKNIGLIYTAGPLGKNAKADGEGPVDPARATLVKDSPTEFLDEVSKTAMNVMCAILDYNTFHAGRLETPKIEVVRVPIISGGIFKHPDVKKHEVALALLWGIHSALAPAADSACPEVELMPCRDMTLALMMYKQALPCASKTISL